MSKLSKISRSYQKLSKVRQLRNNDVALRVNTVCEFYWLENFKMTDIKDLKKDACLNFVTTYSRVPLTARRLTGRSDNRPFICSVNGALNDSLTEQKRPVIESNIFRPFGRKLKKYGRITKHKFWLVNRPNGRLSSQIIFKVQN
jgi:hypothetical protein